MGICAIKLDGAVRSGQHTDSGNSQEMARRVSAGPAKNKRMGEAAREGSRSAHGLPTGKEMGRYPRSHLCYA